MVCESISVKYVAPGWGCCSCKKSIGNFIYNGVARRVCKECGHKRCGLKPCTLHVSHVDATRLRVLLRDGGIDPSTLTDEQVRERYKKRFSEWLHVNKCDPAR